MPWENDTPEVSLAKELINRAEEQIKAHDYDGALRLLEEAEAIYSGNYLIYYKRCYIYIHLGRFEEALAAGNIAVELAPDIPETHCNRAAALDSLGRYEEAVADCDEAIHLTPDYEMAYYNKGVALGNMKRYEESIAAYNRAIGFNPNYTYALFNRASMQACMGRREEMLVDLARAIELDAGERKYADEDENFDPYRDDPDFRMLVYPEESEG